MEVIKVAHIVQKSVFDFLSKLGIEKIEKVVTPYTNPPPSKAPSAKAPPPPNVTAAITAPLKPVEVAGFYKVTSSTEVTFYSTTTWDPTVGEKWSALNITGLIGQLQTHSVSNVSGNVNVTSLVSEPYNWSFTLQTDTEQSVNDVRWVMAGALYPPGQVVFSVPVQKFQVKGSFTTRENIITFTFIDEPPPSFEPGWVVQINSDSYQVAEFGKHIYNGTDKFGNELYTTKARLTGSTKLVNNITPTYITALISSPNYATTFKPATFTYSTNKLPDVKINTKIVTGLYTKFRDLNKDFTFPEEPHDLTELKDERFSAAALLALFAKGPQDEFLFGNQSRWDPTFKQHTNAVMFNRAIPLPGPSPTYQGQVSTVILYPNQLGDLFSNMYLRVNVPSGIHLAPNIGRSLIKQIDFLINETIVETLYDDWYIIRDQMFLDADEQYAMNTAMSGVNGEIIIPLEFFFCRRHSTNNSGRERLRKPYFPVCAIKNQLIYIRFTFHPYQWWTDDTSGTADISNPVIITEEILLEERERMYYKNTPLRYIVNTVKKDATLTYTSNQPIINLTAAFPVQTIAWFFRNKNYERVMDGLYYDSRYSYGYTTHYISTAVPMQFPSGNTNFIDVVTSAKLTLNGMDVTSVLPGGLYFGFKQPMEHFLSIPSKNIYSYSFGLTPKEYNQGGYLNFSKLQSQTTTLTLTFDPTYTVQVIQGYNLYVFYYGYNFLEFRGGFARLPFSS